MLDADMEKKRITVSYYVAVALSTIDRSQDPLRCANSIVLWSSCTTILNQATTVYAVVDWDVL